MFFGRGPGPGVKAGVGNFAGPDMATPCLRGPNLGKVCWFETAIVNVRRFVRAPILQAPISETETIVEAVGRFTGACVMSSQAFNLGRLGSSGWAWECVWLLLGGVFSSPKSSTEN